MNKKTALLTLLENSFWINDAEKLKIISKIDTLSEEQLDTLGKFLADERNTMLKDGDQIIENSQKILETIGEAV